ncbi:hypothetical protein MP228_007535 [Amoeboaphelidium protococcarum]|nr:hypothetical protein MP228_007535 [Amoeboaphelidium protococcarum]
MGKSERPPCQKFACEIQDCLVRNDYDKDKCLKEVVALRQCCFRLFDRGGESVSCSNKWKAEWLALAKKSQ